MPIYNEYQVRGIQNSELRNQGSKTQKLITRSFETTYEKYEIKINRAKLKVLSEIEKFKNRIWDATKKCAMSLND